MILIAQEDPCMSHQDMTFPIALWGMSCLSLFTPDKVVAVAGHLHYQRYFVSESISAASPLDCTQDTQEDD